MRFPAIAALLSSTVTLACGSDPAPPPAAPAGTTQAPTAAPVASQPAPPPPKPEEIYRQSQINISDEILKACGIAQADAFFAFDSANVREVDHRVLGALAQCFSTGPLKGREMRIVGHADPRGDSEYNMVLGDRRAGSVKDFIGQKGLDANQMNTTSRGEMDATGTDEASWAKDRRVDILLGD